jgi:hypothetical protein
LFLHQSQARCLLSWRTLHSSNRSMFP